MKRLRFALPLLAGVPLLAGCPEGYSLIPPNGPYDTGWELLRVVQEVVTTKQFMIRGTNPPEESRGPREFGDDCTDAKTSVGKTTTTMTVSVDETHHVIGQTELGHPKMPGEDSFAAGGVSIVEYTGYAENRTVTQETHRDPDADQTNIEEDSLAHTGAATLADYYGVAADEYVVRIDDVGDVWFRTPGTDIQSSAPLNPYVLTRNGPGAGQMWTNANSEAEIIYTAMGTEDVEIDGQNHSSVIVDVHQVDNIDPAARSMVTSCLKERTDVTTTTEDNVDDTETARVHLDPGCVGSFTHAKQGTQWWAKNWLVKADLLTTDVQITDYGYQWYEDDGSCQRYTSTALSGDDDPDPTDDGVELYVQYSLTETRTQIRSTRFGAREE